MSDDVARPADVAAPRPGDEENDVAKPVSRRGVLLGAGGAAAGLVVGGVGGLSLARADRGPVPPGPAAGGGATTGRPGAVPPVPAAGTHQAGIAVPATPQPLGVLLVLDVEDKGDVSWLAGLGREILKQTGPGHDADLLPDGPGGLTVTVGLGPALLRGAAPGLPVGLEDLPSFAKDASIAERNRGGDVLIAAYGHDPAAIGAVLARLAAAVPRASVRWRQSLMRGPGQGTVVRNPLGFRDGIIVPRGDEELTENVWLGDEAAGLAGGTICVVRRLRLSAADFDAHPVAEQERIIGRRKADGAPLSGGGPGDQVNLETKHADGEYLTPARSHARAAHPSFTGSHLMLRRGYAFDNGSGADGSPDSGLAFICFQRDLHTFVATQRRLDEQDDLMEYVTPTASATFLILPGHTEASPLGASLT